MADELPEPKSRKESYLAKAAGMDVTIPEKPESRLEQYLDAIAEGGGGGGGGGPTVVQTAGNSTTDVMSQNATTSMVFDDPAAQANIKIGDRSSVVNPNGCVTIGERASGGRDAVTIGSQTTGGVAGCVAIGHSANGTSNSVAIGYSASSGNRTESVAIGHSASTGGAHPGSVALGAYATCTRAGEVYIGSSNTSYGYNSTNYRVLGGVHDGQDAHDATTVGQVNTRLGGLTLLPITQAAYDALATKDANTLYVITGA